VLQAFLRSPWRGPPEQRRVLQQRQVLLRRVLQQRQVLPAGFPRGRARCLLELAGRLPLRSQQRLRRD
jgi:hypothetical protein